MKRLRLSALTASRVWDSSANSLGRCRRLHHVPEVMYPVDPSVEGIKPVFGQDSYSIAWTQYQHYILGKLNDQVKGTPNEDASVFTTILRSNSKPSQSAAFNYASQAHNNHFFFSHLTPNANQSEVPNTLREAIDNQFGSMEAFRKEMIDSADSIFGNGWLWLVLDQEQNLRLLPTYNAGTPYVWGRRQTIDPNTDRDMVNYVAPRRFSLVPLLNVNCWQHCWLPEYGISGKREYLENWWTCIDWSKVGDTFAKARDPLEKTPVFQ